MLWIGSLVVIAVGVVAFILLSAATQEEEQASGSVAAQASEADTSLEDAA